MKLLPRTFESVWQQKFKDFEVIVVDDGSVDGTRAYVESVRKPIQLLCQSNQGPGVARNLGVTHSRGEYVAFLDSDDIWFPWTLEVMAQVIQDHKRPAIISSKLVEFAEETDLDLVKSAPAKVE